MSYVDTVLTGRALDEWRERATTAEGRLARGLRELDHLIETVESECSPEDGVCHEHDLTDDYRCALLADLERIADTLAGVLS